MVCSTSAHSLLLKLKWNIFLIFLVNRVEGSCPWNCSSVGAGYETYLPVSDFVLSHPNWALAEHKRLHLAWVSSSLGTSKSPVGYGSSTQCFTRSLFGAYFANLEVNSSLKLQDEMFLKTPSQHEKLHSQYSLLPENPHFNQSNKIVSEKEVIQPAKKKRTKQPLLETLCYPSEKITQLNLRWGYYY